jgi:hypothetical protein
MRQMRNAGAEEMASSASRVQVERDLVCDFQEQLGFLISSAAGYDAGTQAEAKRLALHLRILLHDSPTTSRGRPQLSVLSRMGARDTLPWTDTSAGDPPAGALVIGAGLAMMRVAGGPEPRITYEPFLGNHGEDRNQPPQAFSDWWTETVMLDATGNAFSRSGLVLSVCNQDGGAHIDEELPPAYAALTRQNSLGITIGEPVEKGAAAIAFNLGGTAEGKPLDNSPALANVRQIAWEAHDTLQRHLIAEPAAVYVRAPICRLSFNEAPSAGRNDPCPCGSGRKFKLCFGRRQSRRFHLPTETQAGS